MNNRVPDFDELVYQWLRVSHIMQLTDHYQGCVLFFSETVCLTKIRECPDFIFLSYTGRIQATLGRIEVV